MQKSKKLIALTLLAGLMVGCTNGGASSQEDYYDDSWTPGENAYVDAKQPEIKNPKGEFNSLSDMRRTQGKASLPSKGEANMLVVPIVFKGDKEIEAEDEVFNDLSFDEQDIKDINDTYFKKDASSLNPSVSSFYKTSSYDKLNIDGVVAPVIEIDFTFDYVIQEMMNGVTVYEIVEYITNFVIENLFDDTETYYIGDFDSDNDGKIDSLNIITHYPANINFTNETLNTLYKSLISAENIYFSSDYVDARFNALTLFSKTYLEVKNDTDSHLPIYHVGKMLGLDDYLILDTSFTNGTFRTPMGLSDPMAGYVGDHNMFSKFQLGWVEPTFISMNDLTEEGKEIEIKPSFSSGDVIILHTGDKPGIFDEYLILDLYSPYGINLKDKGNYVLGSYNKVFDKVGLRVLHADARLVKGFGDTYHPFGETPDFDEVTTLANGNKQNYIFDYRNTNGANNKYFQFGITNDEPLVTILNRSGYNPHNVYGAVQVDSSYLFQQGDSFGTEDQIEGAYKNFRFWDIDGEGEELGIAFEVKNLSESAAKIKFWRAK